MSTDVSTEWVGHTVTLEHTFAAPRQLVWEAWTESAQLARWWGPDHFTAPVCELELRSGGALRIDMLGPDGHTYPMTGIVTEVDAPRRLRFTSRALDDNGSTMFELLNTVTFADAGDTTILTLEARVLAVFVPYAGMHLSGMRAGWEQSLGKLERLLPDLATTPGGAKSE